MPSERDVIRWNRGGSTRPTFAERRYASVQTYHWRVEVTTFQWEIITATKTVNIQPFFTLISRIPFGRPVVPLENSKYASVSRFVCLGSTRRSLCFFASEINPSKEREPCGVFPSRM